MYFFQTPSFVKRAFPHLLWEFNNQEQVLYLTFDDGPDERATPFVLDILLKYQAKATFFLVGEQVKKYPDLVDRILREGHAIGNHTQHHIDAWKVSTTRYKQDIEACADTLGEQGVKTNLFRPPYGRLNWFTMNQIATCYRVALWSHLSGDFDKKLDRKRSIASLKLAKSGSILLFHTSSKSFENTRYLLPVLMDHFSNLDFTFDKIT